MAGEANNCDYKLTFDLNDTRTKLKLVKLVVAMANTGGGKIIIGRNETIVPGVSSAMMRAFDSANIANIVQPYAMPASIQLAHDVDALDNELFVCTISIEASSLSEKSRKVGGKALSSRLLTSLTSS